MTETVDWVIFVWAIGIILLLFGIVFNYINQKAKDRQEDIDRHDTELEEVKKRIDKMEECHTTTQVDIAKINKDIEYIKVKQDEIVLMMKDHYAK